MNINNFYETERFKRNTIVKSIGTQGQQRLFDKKVLVAGAGGLGSGVISSLVSAGIGSIGIIDRDIVEISNLNRQFIHIEASAGKLKVESAYEWIKKYSPKTGVIIYKTRIKEDSDVEFFQEYDLVIDCFDSYSSKFILNKVCTRMGLPLIHGGVEDFYGQVLTVIPGRSSCLNCLFETPDTQTKRTLGVISPAVNVISSIQSMEAVKFLLGFEDLLADTLLTYDGLRQEFRRINLCKKALCPACGVL